MRAALVDRREVQTISRQLNVQLAQHLAKFQPAQRVSFSRRVSQDVFLLFRRQLTKRLAQVRSCTTSLAKGNLGE